MLNKCTLLDKEDSFTEKLAANITKNIEVQIEDVHIRYEDSYTNPANPFSIGVTLKGIHFVVSMIRVNNFYNLKKDILTDN